MEPGANDNDPRRYLSALNNPLFGEQMLADTLDRINEGFLMVDRNFVYTYANRKLGEMVGKSPAELIGKKMWDLFPDAVGSSTYIQMQQAMQENVPVTGLDYYPPLDLWQENRIYPSENGLSVFIRDISEKKRSEMQIEKNERIYKAIAANIPGSVICLFDRDFRYQLVEGDLVSVFGHSKEDLQGKLLREVVSDERRKFLTLNLRKAFHGETLMAETTVNGYRLLYRFVPLRDEQESIFCVMLMGIDITELKAAQEKIQRQNTILEKAVANRTRQLQDINKELESFSYSVAHDLMTPVRALSGYSEMLQDACRNQRSSDVDKFADRISKNALKMAELIQSLLTFSNLGSKELKLYPLKMREIVLQASEQLSEGQPLPENFVIGTLPDARGDAVLIRQVWQNLISNAIKYSAKNPNPKIEVGAEIRDEHAVYWVKDNGVGFDMGSYSRLFGVFQRLHRQDDYPGNGIGLATAARIVHRHSGRIWAEGVTNQGATFYFTLPHQSPADQ